MMRLAEKEYWDTGYRDRPDLSPIIVSGYKNFYASEIYQIKKNVGFDRKKILEVGGGGSQWLALLSKQHPSSIFVALDYSEEGCSLIEEYAKNNKLRNLKVTCKDLFDCSVDEGKFDVIYSHGVVEHFQDLSQVMLVIKKLLAENGRLITFIPNMSGVIGKLTKFFKKEVYNIHVIHDKESFIKGHTDAGLEVIESGYLCSSNFGVLSSCFSTQKGWRWEVYRFLTRLSKTIWAFETRVFKLPTSRFFSPYIYVIAKKP